MVPVDGKRPGGVSPGAGLRWAAGQQRPEQGDAAGAGVRQQVGAGVPGIDRVLAGHQPGGLQHVAGGSVIAASGTHARGRGGDSLLSSTDYGRSRPPGTPHRVQVEIIIPSATRITTWRLASGGCTPTFVISSRSAPRQLCLGALFGADDPLCCPLIPPVTDAH